MYVYVAFDLKNIIMFDKESLQDIHNYIYFKRIMSYHDSSTVSLRNIHLKWVIFCDFFKSSLKKLISIVDCLLFGINLPLRKKLNP